MSLKQRCHFDAEPLYLVDGTAFVYRAYYANRALQRADGHPTGALYVTTRLLLRLLREERPRHAVFFMDGKGPHFRHTLYPLYKANRDATPEDLVLQLEPVQRMVRALGLCLEVPQGCEADDGIASVTARFAPTRPVVIVGADKDLRQCLAPNVTLWDPSTQVRDEKILTEQSFIKDTGLHPAQWPDVQAVTGDSSDNIPGVPGIGPKTAAKLFADYATLEELRDNLASLPPKLRDKIAPHIADIFIYRELTRLAKDRCPHLNLTNMAVLPVDIDAATDIMREYELYSLLRELDSMQRTGLLSAPQPQNKTDKTSGADTIHETDKASQQVPQQASQQAPQIYAQGNLFNTAAPAQNTSLTSLPTISDALALPDCRAVTVALVPCALLAPRLGPPAVPPNLLSHSPSESTPPEGYIFVTVAKKILNKEPNLQICHSERSEESSDSNGSICEVLYTGPTTALVPVLSQAACIITPDVKYLLNTEAALRDVPPNLWFDLGLAAYLCNPEERNYDWPHLSRRIAPTDILGSPTGAHTASQGRIALTLGVRLAKQLTDTHLDTLYREMELPLIPVLADMERRGIAIDTTALNAFLHDVQGNLDAVTRTIHALAGGPFNIRSAQQLGDVLFRTLNLPTAGKTPGGQFSTAQAALEKLAGKHPLVDAVLEFRKLEKLRSTYLEPLPKLADANGRIHTTFNQKATSTGRLSSSNPNLQNIPVRGEFGQRMRACFVARPGNALISADYSQIELRVLAHISQDPVLLDAFAKGQDIHTRTAALIYALTPETVSAEQRRNAKTINFGLIYGMGAQKLAQEIRVSLTEAKAFIEHYFKHLTTLKRFYETVEANAKKYGYVSTLAGRRRILPDICSANQQLQSLARRQAINTVIQGSAADIIKLAMLAVAKDAQIRTLGVRLILQVHDELLLEAPTENAQATGMRVATLMGAVRPGGTALDVPLLVDWGVACAWKEAH